MLANLFRSWLRLAARGWTASRFHAEAADQSHLRTFTGILVAAALGLAVSLLAGRLAGVPLDEFKGLASVWTNRAKPPITSWLVLVPFGVVYGFYLFQVILCFVARLLGGRGSFGTQAYLQLLFYAPLAVAQQAVVVLPDAGRYLFAVLALCSLWPTTTSLKAAHGYSTARAVATWIIPIVLNVIVVIIVIAAIAYRR